MLRRITRKLAILAVLAGMLSGLAPSMLAVRTAHADEASRSGASTVLDRSSAPAPKRSEAAEPEPLTAADLQVRSAVVPSDALASGTAGTCLFYITSDLQMVITPADGAHGVLPNLYASEDWPWYRYAAYIKTIRFDRGVKTGDSLNWAFSNGSADAAAYNRLESVDFTNLDAADLTQMYGILAYDRTLTEVNMNMLNAVQVRSMAEAFRSTGITGLDLTAIGDGKLWSIDGMCNACKRLESVTTGWTLPVLYFAQGTFGEDARLASIDAENWRFGQAGSLSLMFNGCSGLKTLDVSRWNVGSVFNLYHTFDHCTGLKTLDVSGWNTGSLTDARGLFHHCTGLKTLDVSGWNTGKVTSFENIFAYCTSLTELDVSGWNTGKATSMSGMFDQDGKLTVLDVSRWDTSNVQDMSGMFRDTGIATLDVSQWNVSHVGNAAGMFNDCVNLVTLDTSRWRLDSAWGLGACSATASASPVWM
ncbi:MAG: BspA family leucine-rich repeat surface protein [Bifidobacterium adolescentis]